jgi:hypothetical protein
MFDKLKEQKELYTITIKQALYKSREVLNAYVGTISGLLTANGDAILDAFNQNSPQLQSAVPKLFGVLSAICALFAIYLKIKTKSVVVSKNAEPPVLTETMHDEAK